jgi:hypothetical protein
MSQSGDKQRDSEHLEKLLSPDLALLFAAIRSEFDAKIRAESNRIMVRILAMGIPLGAVGGFAAEWVRTGSANAAISTFIPFL